MSFHIDLTPEQQEDARIIEDNLRAAMNVELRNVAMLLASKPDRELFGETEFQVRDAMHRIGARGLDSALEARKKKGYEGSSISCPKCQENAQFKGYRECDATSLMGEIRYARAYYHCASCHHGHFPTDEVLGLDNKQKLTLGAREVITHMGVTHPFEEAATTALPLASGLRVSESTVERTTEDVGADVAQRRAEGKTVPPDKEWEWHADASGEHVAYVSLDATSVPQQGPNAKKSDGRMPWVGSVFNPGPKDRPRAQGVINARYVSGLISLPEIGAQLRRECQAVGIGRADVVIGLTDGGNGLENCLIDVLSGIAPRVVFILDFFHAAEHLREFGKVWIPDEARRKALVEKWCHTLKHEGGKVLFSELEALDLSRASAAVKKAHAGLLGYLGSNLHRTDYPEYLARDWQIGSGMIESACKTIVGQRLKLSGMRWGDFGTNALCQLRALYKSERHLWRAYWNRSAPATAMAA